MLNIGDNQPHPINYKTAVPIFFSGVNICGRCAAEGSLTFIDKFGNITKKDIYPFTSIYCTKCGYKYFLAWERDEEKNKMYPVAVDEVIKDIALQKLISAETNQ